MIISGELKTMLKKKLREKLIAHHTQLIQEVLRCIKTYDITSGGTE